MTEEENITTFCRIFDEIWHQPEKTVEVISSTFTDDYLLHISSLAEPLTKEAFTVFVPQWQKAFPDGRMDVLDISVTGNKVWCYWKSVGTHSADYLGICATGRYVNYKGVDIWKFTDDGHVIESWAIPDVLSLLRQLGVISHW